MLFYAFVGVTSGSCRVYPINGVSEDSGVMWDQSWFGADFAKLDATDMVAVDAAAMPDLVPLPDSLIFPDLIADAASPDLVPSIVPASWSSPGVPTTGPLNIGQFNGSYARPFRLQLDTDVPMATIFYTVDGSMPSVNSPSGTAPLTLTLGQTTTVKYFARTGAGGETTSHTETFGVNAANQTYAGWIVEDFSIAGMGGVAVVAAGQLLNATTNFQVWVQSANPGNSQQLVYGVDDTDIGCLYSGTPGVYPGVAVMQKTFTLTAPSNSGVHHIRVAYIQDSSCSVAMMNNPTILKTRPNTARMGILVVK